MITPSFSPTATERVLPKLALDFTTASLDSRVTFTRTTDATHPATYINSSGLVASATDNQPRFDYDPITLACKGLLIEESRTNLILSSTYTANTNGWTNGVAGTPGTITSVSLTNPAGTTTGVYELAGVTGASYVGNFMTVTTSTNAYTGTYFVKNNGGESAQMRIVFSGGTYVAYGTKFVFATESFVDSPGGTTAPTSRSFTKLSNGWYRISITASNNGSVGNTSAQFLFYGGGYTTDYYFWGAQFEQASFPTSYIPTTSAALTRNADVATMTGTNFSSWYNQTEGAFEVEFQTLNGVPSTNGRYVSANDGTSSNTVQLYGTSSVGLSIAVGGVAQTTPTVISLGSNLYNINKIAGVYKANSAALALNATTINVSSPASVPSSLTQMNIGNQADGTRQYNGLLRKINYWPQRIINAEALAFSK